MSETTKPTLKAKKEGFPKSIRIKRESEFKEVLREGTRKGSNNFVVFRLLRGDQRGQKFGIKIGKGIKKATQRNKIKRVIREVLRKNKDRFDKNASVVVLCKTIGGEIDPRMLREELESLIRL